MKRTAKKLFVGFAVVFTLLVMTLAAGTTLLVNHLDYKTTVKTTTCYSDGTHCRTTVETNDK